MRPKRVGVECHWSYWSYEIAGVQRDAELVVLKEHNTRTFECDHVNAICG